MIDWSRVNSLRMEIGDDSFDEVVEIFLEEVESVVSRLRSDPNPAKFEEDLHFLKGSAWNLGFLDFGALCQEGERLAAHGNAAKVNMGAVIDCYAESRVAFVAGLRKRDGRITAA
ncbi:Hpt domain-containing protein [Defluviimonas sp. WL0002]|uniref:Hpt domain-containing protein n=1 Tax=Albidovulum marisflavi TaxID=2984159 RepID=A0ABT2Z8D4_9RHOB|nr:Hpt domain-containing protein [Defluviimonas sp. WL0002]MCV2867398.1 Hpt domain-containing protein [Defluviimonas sp. WL0002]